MTRSQQQVSQDIVRLLVALHAVGEDRERHTILTRDLAEAAVALREHYLTPEGRPDWTGRTWAYRNAMRQLYGEAGYDAAARAVTQAATRYHVGNIVRRYLSPEEIAEVGLRPETPQERQVAHRAKVSAMLAGRGQDGFPPRRARYPDPLRSLRADRARGPGVRRDDRHDAGSHPYTNRQAVGGLPGALSSAGARQPRAWLPSTWEQRLRS